MKKFVDVVEFVKDFILAVATILVGMYIATTIPNWMALHGHEIEPAMIFLLVVVVSLRIIIAILDWRLDKSEAAAVERSV